MYIYKHRFNRFIGSCLSVLNSTVDNYHNINHDVPDGVLCVCVCDSYLFVLTAILMNSTCSPLSCDYQFLYEIKQQKEGGKK